MAGGPSTVPEAVGFIFDILAEMGAMPYIGAAVAIIAAVAVYDRFANRG